MEKKACATMSYGTSWPIKLRDNNGETNEGNEAGVNQAAICLWHGRCPHPPPPPVTTSCVTSPPPPPTPIPYPPTPTTLSARLVTMPPTPPGVNYSRDSASPSLQCTIYSYCTSITSHIFLIQTCRILCFDVIIYTYFDCILWDWNILRAS